MERNIIDYLPPVFRGVRDIFCVMECLQDIFSDFWQKDAALEDDLFIESAQDRGLVRWEAIFGLQVSPEQSIESRRQRVLACLTRQTPYCKNSFVGMVEAIVGDAQGFRVWLGDLRLSVMLLSHLMDKQEEIEALMGYVVPINVETKVELLRNRHRDLNTVCHKTLGRHTHTEIRNEVLT